MIPHVLRKKKKIETPCNVIWSNIANRLTIIPIIFKLRRYKKVNIIVFRKMYFIARVVYTLSLCVDEVKTFK